MKVQLAIIIMFIMMKSIIHTQVKAKVEFGILVKVMSAQFVDLQLKNRQSLKRVVLITMNRKQNMIKKKQSMIMQ